MESYRNPIINKEIEKVTVSGFENIQEMLSAHLSLLMQHYTYLNKITLGRIAEDDVFDYLKDVLGFGVPDNGKFKTDYLPELLVSLKTQIDVFMKLCEVSKHPNQQVAVSTLYLALDLELAYAKHHAKMASFNQTYFKYKMHTIMGGPDCIKSFLKCLKVLLPASHKQLADIIYFNQELKSEYKKKGNQTHTEFSTSWSYAWNKAFLKIEKFIRDLGGNVIKKAKAKDQTQAELNEAEEGTKEWAEIRKQQVMLKQGQKRVDEEEKNKAIDAIASIPDIANKLHARMNKNKLHVSIVIQDNYDLLLNNVVFYYEIYPFINGIEDALLKLKEEQQAVQDLQKTFNNAKSDVAAMLLSLNRFSGLLVRSIKKASQGRKYAEYMDSFAGLLNEIKGIEPSIQALNEIFPKELMIDWADDFIEQLLSKYKDAYKQIKQQLKDIQARFLDILELAQQEAKKPEPQVAPSIRPPVQNPERVAYLKEREKITQEYKASVSQRKQEKEARNKVKPTIAEVQPENIIVYKNIAVEECLLGLSDQHFELLLDLFKFKKGIRYADVCNFIVNQLGGEIEEIGNGSSHKRIRIAKYFVDVTSHEGEKMEQEITSSPSVAVGGFFRPHGGAHQSGVMARFNMELVVNTFMKAGITQEVLNQLQEKRLEKRVQAGI